MNEGQLMGDFEMESKQLEAESWSRIVDSKFLKQQKKDVVKRQEVIYGESLQSLCKSTFNPGNPWTGWKASFQVLSMSQILFKNFGA